VLRAIGTQSSQNKIKRKSGVGAGFKPALLASGYWRLGMEGLLYSSLRSEFQIANFRFHIPDGMEFVVSPGLL